MFRHSETDTCASLYIYTYIDTYEHVQRSQYEHVVMNIGIDVDSDGVTGLDTNTHLDTETGGGL